DLPFEKLVEQLQPERDMSRSPIFQTAFALQNAPMPTMELSGLSLSILEIDSGATKFDLSLSMTETEEGLVGSLEYNTDLLDESTIVRMIGHLQTLLESIVANPEIPISELQMLTQTEQHQLLVEFNDTLRDYPKDKCVHQLFEAQALRRPEAAALVFEGRELSYKELNARANKLAHYLQSLGVGPEQLVGICLERSTDMVVGLLGILKAGGAYLPLDPAYPIDRLAFMLEDSQAPVILTQTRLVES